jgi:transposase-like protein
MPRYPEAMKQQAIELFNQGFSTGVISKKLGIHKKTVRSWLKSANVNFPNFTPPYPESYHDEALKLYKDGLAISKIAKKLGAAETTISRWLRKKGVPPKSQVPCVPIKLSGIKRGYIAGILDGEGTFSIYEDKHSWGKRSPRIFPEISVNNTNKDLIYLLVKDFGFRYRGCHYNDRLPNRKKLYRASIRRFIDVETMLQHVSALLIIKRKQAEILKRFIQLRKTKLKHGVKTKDYGEEEKELIRQIRELNKRGL